MHGIVYEKIFFFLFDDKKYFKIDLYFNRG